MPIRRAVRGCERGGERSALCGAPRLGRGFHRKREKVVAQLVSHSDTPLETISKIFFPVVFQFLELPQRCVLLLGSILASPRHSNARNSEPRMTRRRASRGLTAMDSSTGVTAAQAARDEELRGACAKAFAHYKKGNLTRGTKLLEKLLARHPAHPLLNFAYARLSHKRALAAASGRQEYVQGVPLARSSGAQGLLGLVPAIMAPPRRPDLLRLPHTQRRGRPRPDILRTRAAEAAASPLDAADFELAKAIAMFDEDALLLLPDARECADSAAYQTEALANLTKAPAMITDLHRAAENLARRNLGQPLWDRFMRLRDTKHASEAARRLRRVQARAREEEAHRALAAVHRVMAGEGAAHDLQEAAAGWRESADQGDAGAQLLIGALQARGRGGVKKILLLGKKRYLELSAAAGNEDAVALLKELRKCVACGTLDVHHMICSRCRNVRYCDAACQMRHWRSPTDPHTSHCVMRREGGGGRGFLLGARGPRHGGGSGGAGRGGIG